MKWVCFKLTALLASPVFLALMVSGQTCSLDLSVYKFTRPLNEDRIEGVAIELVNITTKKKVRPISKEQSGYFENLNKGPYKVTLTKKGFKQTVNTFEFGCDHAWEGVTTEVRFLWEGDPKQKVRLDWLAEGKIKGERMFRASVERDWREGATIPKPKYPPSARAARATGAVEVEVLLNELGKVIWAKAVSGNLLLQQSAVAAAKGASFRPTFMEGMPVKILGRITYNFVP